MRKTSQMSWWWDIGIEKGLHCSRILICWGKIRILPASLSAVLSDLAKLEKLCGSNFALPGPEGGFITQLTLEDSSVCMQPAWHSQSPVEIIESTVMWSEDIWQRKPSCFLTLDVACLLWRSPLPHRCCLYKFRLFLFSCFSSSSALCLNGKIDL